jgi:hypothetical protein
MENEESQAAKEPLKGNDADESAITALKLR